MKLKEIKELLESANLDEKQIKALDEFFEAYTTKVREDERGKLKTNKTSEDEMIPKKDAEMAFKRFQEDAETAFNLFKEDSIKAFDLFKVDAKKAFELYGEDLQQEYTENMIKGLQELYTDIEERVKQDFLESQDVKVLNDIKKTVAPLFVAEKEQILLEEIERLKAERIDMLSETKELSRGKLISELVSGFPKEYVEDIKDFISTGRTEDDIYERFSVICELIDKGALNKKSITEEESKITEKKKEESSKKTVVTEEANTKTPKIKIKKKILTEAQSTINSKSKKPEPIKKEEENYFTEEEVALLEMINF